MSSKKSKMNYDDNVMDLTQDDAFDAVMALTSASSSQKSTTSGFTASGVTSSSQTSSSSRRSIGSLEENGKKKTTAAERQNKRLKKEEGKAAKAAAVEKNKMYKPGECMKYMKIDIHPALASAWYMSDVAREAAAAGCAVHAAQLCDTGLVLWGRRLQTTISVRDGQCGLNTEERCDRALYISLADDVADKVASHTLSQHVAYIRDLSSCQLTLVVFGVKDYFKSSGRKTQNSSRKLMTEIELEMAIADVLVSSACDTVLVDTPNELALLIIQHTKAVAEDPYKQAKRSLDEQADFYMRGDNKKCVRVDANGNGVSSLWQQMVAVLPHSSLETARAVCAQYRAPRELHEALQLPDSVSTLADLTVSRSGVAGARGRRLGPEFARKLATLFTATDGSVLIQ